MKTNHSMRRGFTLVELLVVIVIIAALAGLTAPMVIRQRKKADQTEAVSNARQIGLAMFEFENEYGSFPEAGLGATINGNTGTTLAPTTITTANDAFRQLLAAGIAQGETMFFCKTAYSTAKPDNIFNSDTTALKKGEVGYGYIMNGITAFSTAGNPGRALLATPLKYAGTFTAGEFDKEIYDSKAVVLKIDNSVTSLAINNLNKAVLGGGKTLLDGNSADTIWGAGVTPVIVDPDPK
jgi:prepilin-type N-terminal cleavage/methylation domain-containing protein